MCCTFLLLWYLYIKMCQESDLKVLMLLLSHKHGFCLLIPRNILWEKQQLWTLSRKCEEILYPLPLRIAVKNYLLSRMEWQCVTLTVPQALHLWIWGSDYWADVGQRAREKEKLSHKLEAKYPHISWITNSFFLQHPGEYKCNKATDRNIFFSDTHNWTCCTLIRNKKPN